VACAYLLARRLTAEDAEERRGSKIIGQPFDAIAQVHDVEIDKQTKPLSAEAKI
jgi:hypothetical protein